ncbi:MAG: hypothetical protein ACREYF_21485 [Gammaproteobacteria bacterium]
MRQKILRAKEMEKLLVQLKDNLNAILESLAERIQAIERAIEYCESLKPLVPHAGIYTYQYDKLATRLEIY